MGLGPALQTDHPGEQGPPSASVLSSVDLHVHPGEGREVEVVVAVHTRLQMMVGVEVQELSSTAPDERTAPERMTEVPEV